MIGSCTFRNRIASTGVHVGALDFSVRTPRHLIQHTDRVKVKM